MFGKNKYDIMERELFKGVTSLLPPIIKLLYLKIKVNKGKFGDDKLVVALSNFLSDNLDLLQNFCHLYYENLKDLDKMDKQELFEYIKESNLTLREYCCQYIEYKMLFEQMLMFLALLDRDKVSFADFINAEIMEQVNKGNFENILLEANKLSEKSLETLSAMIINGAEVSDLGEEDIKLFEDYHNKYMMQKIYSKANKKEVSETKMIRMAKLLILRKPNVEV